MQGVPGAMYLGTGVKRGGAGGGPQRNSTDGVAFSHVVKGAATCTLTSNTHVLGWDQPRFNFHSMSWPVVRIGGVQTVVALCGLPEPPLNMVVTSDKVGGMVKSSKKRGSGGKLWNATFASSLSRTLVPESHG